MHFNEGPISVNQRASVRDILPCLTEAHAKAEESKGRARRSARAIAADGDSDVFLRLDARPGRSRSDRPTFEIRNLRLLPLRRFPVPGHLGKDGSHGAGVGNA